MNSISQTMIIYEWLYKLKQYWQNNKFSYTYIYNCFSGANGNKIYFISCGIVIGIYIATCILLHFLNSIATCMITVGLIFLLIHIDVVIKSDKFPWRRKFDDPKYTHLKKGVLEPIKNIRNIIYDKVGISTENQPKLTGFYIMFIGGIVMIIILSIIPIKAFIVIFGIGLCTIPQGLRHYFKKDIEKHDMVKELCEEELKKKDMYVSKQEVYEMKTSMTADPEKIKKYGEAKKFKKQFKKEIETSNIDVEEFMKSRIEKNDNNEKKENQNEEKSAKQKLIEEKMKRIIESSLTESQRSHNMEILKEQGKKKNSSTAFADLAKRFSVATASGEFDSKIFDKRIDMNKLDKFEQKHKSLNVPPQIIDESSENNKKPKSE